MVQIVQEKDGVGLRIGDKGIIYMFTKELSDASIVNYDANHGAVYYRKGGKKIRMDFIITEDVITYLPSMEYI